ncbi:MAG TPA: hypothetical protein VM689_14255 [Aliidongia sp.]|nr:hypothetical protein [Aliidongia sp.]
MRPYSVAVVIVFLGFIPSISAIGGAAEFPTEEAAQKYCPDDKVVWYNRATGNYHFKGHTWYGVGREGTYICLKEAVAAGYKTPKG